MQEFTENNLFWSGIITISDYFALMPSFVLIRILEKFKERFLLGGDSEYFVIFQP